MQIAKTAFNRSVEFITKASFIVLMLIFSTYSMANTQQTVDELIQNGEVKISITLKEQNQLVPRQQAILLTEIHSQYDFANNMVVDFFNVENAIVSKPYAKTGFKMETIEEKKWYIQNKETALYPLNEGEYNVAPINVQISIIIDGKQVSGTIQTPPLKFSIAQPEQLKGLGDYIASPKFEVVREVTEKPEQPLVIGSAVTVTRTVNGDNLHGVMLPELESIQFDGAQVYEKPTKKADSYHVLHDISQVKFTSEVTFIFQQEGLFKLPAKKVVWWNTSTNKLETTNVPELSFQVGDSTDEIIANAPQTAQSQNQNSPSIINWWLVIVILTVLLFAWAIIKVINRNKQALIANFAHRKYFNKLVDRYLQAVGKGEYELALSYLYKIADIKRDHKRALKSIVRGDNEQVTLQLLFALAYDNKQATESLSTQSAKALLQVIINKRFETHFFTPVNFTMKLN